MANVSRIQGFKPIRHVNGAPWNGMTTPYLCSTADATAIYVGDVVKMGGTAGGAGVVVSGMDVEGMPTCARDTSGTTGQDTVGVVVGFSVDPTNPLLKHRAASTYRIAHVVTDPSVIYEVQEDGVGAALTAAEVGLCTAIITTAGSTVTGMSGMALDSNGTTATTSTLPVKIVGLVKRVDNAMGASTTDLAKWEVIFNTGWYAMNSVGTA